ncbi:MAG: GNAT family N-acetyltransferase [Pseudomonadota bacterium]
MAEPAPVLAIAPAASDRDWLEVARLFRAYADSLDFSLEFQCFGQEVEGLPGDYGAPNGAAFLAVQNDRTIGVVAVRPLEPRVCELKRLYITPEGRGQGLGRDLSRRAMDWAKAAGYDAMRLDTHDSMAAAIALYRDLGFVPIPAYNDHRLDGMHYFECRLAR